MERCIMKMTKLEKALQKAGFDALALPHDCGYGYHVRIHHPNVFTTSIIQTPYSYGWSDGLFEVAIMKGEELVYTTPITSDVLGYLSVEEVVEYHLYPIFAKS